ncbi:Protein of avirulence locus ImpE [Rhodovulum sp. P5]|uniref:type VI secretion system accessory protein TagJ n=1 Tax=Rhodovulum sp. P5 TaxID=1564506 RepID=UPI0009C328DA|nr:type VI secretion system accessory protein TagJ [Rhodovulum sp. P5]ARE41175.1 Protein of avirulence locus ImpE [Rhodovulum sp. P5]
MTAATADAEALVRTGDLDAGLAALQDAVRGNSSDPKLRIFLFQLLCVKGDWNRAVTQLKLCAQLDAAALPMAQTYREGIICEVFREKVFAGEKQPLVFGEPQDWIALMIQALSLQAAGNTAEAAALRARAFEDAPASRGTLNGHPFEWIADADMRLGPVLEAVINGKYYWLPFNAIHRLLAEPPTDLRDTVWTPCNLTLRNGGEFVALIPTRYAGTASIGTDAEKLSRATNWEDAGAETFIGRGQRLLATDAGDTPVMELRELLIDGDGEPAAETTPEAAANG